MKLLSKILVLLALCSWAVPGLAQTSGIINGATPIVGGTTGQCVTRGSNGTVLMAACGGSSVSTFSAGTTGLTPNSATSGAVTLSGTLIGANGGTGVANTGKTITLGGNLTTSGAFATTLISTATTSITLPTTGTLATLAGSEALTNKTINGNTWTAGSSTLTLGGNFTTTGAFNATFAIPGTGTWTFPVAGSSLAPLLSPSFTTPTLGVATATSINGNTITAGAGTLTLGSVTLNAGAGGTLGSNAFTSTAYAPLASPTFTGTVTIPTPFTLGAVSVTATGTQLNYLSTATGVTGSGSNVLSASPSLTGTVAIGGASLSGPDVEVSITGDTTARVAMGINTTDVPRISFGPGNATRDLFLERAGAANLRHGAPAVDTAPVAQTISMQNTLAGGTSNVAGANFTLAMSQGKGTGVGGSFILQVAPAGSTGTAVNALATALTIDSTKAMTTTGSITANLGSANGGFGITSSNTDGPFFSITSTDTGGKQWKLISNASGNVGGAGVLQFYNNTDGGTPAAMILSNTTAAFRGGASFLSDVTISGASFGVSGNISAPTWTTNGVRYKNVSGTLTDTTAATGTTATAYTNVWGGSTIAATNTDVIFTDYFNSYFKAPVAGTNVTLTNAWSVGADSLKVGTSGTFQVSTAGVLTTTGAQLTTPTLGVAAGTSLALGGATIGSNALAVTGTTALSSTLTVGAATRGSVNVVGGSGTFPGSYVRLDTDTQSRIVFELDGSNLPLIRVGPGGGNQADTALTRRAAANWNLGFVDAAAPVAQTLSVQSVVAGTSNTAGVSWTRDASQGTGTGAGGSHIWRVAPAGSTGSAQNALVTALTIDSTKLATFAAGAAFGGNVSMGTSTITWTAGSDRTLFSQGAALISTGDSGVNLIFSSSTAVRINRTQQFEIDSPANNITFKSSNQATTYNVIGTNGVGILRLGATDGASPLAQTLAVQSVSAGNADTSAQNWTFTGSVSTGTGTPGDLVFKTAGKGAASTVQNTLITALTIKGGTTNNTNVGQPSIVIGNAALDTTATDGFLYIPTSAGTPTGTPTSFTGRVALIYDTTNHQFWIYDGGWKQPKTPAAAAIVTWQ